MSILGKIFERREDTYPFQDFNHKNIGAGITSALLAITGPPALVFAAAANGDFTTFQIILWIFSIYVFGGMFGILTTLYYRIPISGATSLTGIAFLATVTSQFTYPELIGSYLMASLLVIIIGYLGIFSKMIEYVPKHIIAAMLAGMIIKYMINLVVSINQLPLIGGISLIVFFIFSKWNKRIPPAIAAIFTAFLLLVFTKSLHNGVSVEPFVFSFQFPTPEFTFLGFLSVSIPLFILLLSNDLAVGFGALEQNDYNPPINKVISLGGLFSIIANFFGCASINIGGMMTAICADEEAGKKEKKYMGSVVSGMILFLFGLFSWKLVPLIQTLPQTFIAIIIGFVLLGVFANSMHASFSKPTMKISATFTLIVAASNITILNIGAPVWALLIGAFIARFIEIPEKI